MLTASDSIFHVAWRDYRNGSPDIFYNRSLDGGLTWAPTDTRIDTSPAGTASAVEPKIASAGPMVVVAWQDFRNNGSDVYCNSSIDGGATWKPIDDRLDTDPPGSAQSRDISVSASLATVVVAWRDLRSFPADIYANYSTTLGTTWQATDVRVDTGFGSALNPAVGVAGSSVFVVYSDAEVGLPDIRGNHSIDGGATWFGQEFELSRDTPGVAFGAYPRVATTETGLFAVWEDDRNGQPDIYFNRLGAMLVPGGCPGLTAPQVDRAPANHASFTIDCPPPIATCTTPMMLLIGTCATPSIPVPPPLGCAACELVIGDWIGAVNGSLTVAPGVPPGLEVCVQCACVALSTGGVPCAALFGGMSIVAMP